MHGFALPPYVVRKSPRAKRAKLKISPLGELEVVIPRGFDSNLIPVLLGEHEHWIARTLAGIETQRRQHHDENEFLPRSIALRAIDECVSVKYQPALFSQLEVEGQGTGKKILKLMSPDEVEARELLCTWLQELAREQLVQMLRILSDQLELPVRKTSVRAQRSRWGSCSSRKNISVNRSLLFLPRTLVRYVLVHELCHTRYLNHSRDYWKLVEVHEPDYRSLDKALRQGWNYVPRWAYPR